MNKRVRTFAAVILFLALCSVPGHAAGKGIVLNFNEVDISTMVKFISDLTGKNIIMDDRVKGKISVYSPSTLSVDEAFNVFTSVLELKGFTVVQAGRVYKIVPISAARQSGMQILASGDRTPINESYIARVVSLSRIPAKEAATFLQPVVSKDGYIASFGPANLLLVVDSALNIRKVVDILNAIDSDMGREDAELIFLQHTSAENVADVVREWLGGRARTGGAGVRTTQTAQAGIEGLLIPDTRLNAVIIFGTSKDKEDIKKIISIVDVVPPTSSSKINVYYLENADAAEVAKVLDGMLKGTSATSTPQAAGAPPQRAFEGGGVSVTSDKATNSLVVMASPTDYQNLVQVIQKLDRRRRQVFIQALVAEVSLDKLKEFGTQLGAAGAGTNGTVAAAGVFDPFNFLSMSNPQQQTVVQVLSGLANEVNFSAVLKALDSNDAINVLSTPNIMTSDNKEAEIFVGENVPFVSSTNLSSTGLSQQSIERKDTGITLKVTPQITEGEYVKLDIYQEISAVKQSQGAAVDLVTTKRSAKTSVVVKDDDTIVIGGLIQNREEEVINKIPILGDIPLLGYLFKTKSKTRQKTNLLILLTPRIVKGTEDIAALYEEQKRRFEREAGGANLDIDKELKSTP